MLEQGANDPATSVQRLEELCADPHLRIKVANNPTTPAHVLAILAQDQDVRVRSAVASHAQTSVEVLQALAQDAQEDVRCEVASHPQTPGEVLRILAQDEDWQVRGEVAKHARTPVAVLRILSVDQDWRVRSEVASHPQTPEEVLRMLAQDEEACVRRSVASHAQTSRDVLCALAQDENEYVLYAVASHPQTPEEVLRALARYGPKTRHVSGKVGLAVAMHPQASAEVLSMLTRSPKAEVQWLASFVQRLLAEVGEAGREQAWWAELRHFFVDEPNRGWIGIMSIETQLREVAALGLPENLRLMILTALAADWDAAKIQHTFAVTDEKDVATMRCARRAFYKRLIAPFIPPVALQKLVASPHWEVRYLVALHEQTPWEARQRLCQDGNHYVRAKARAKAAQMGE